MESKIGNKFKKIDFLYSFLYALVSMYLIVLTRHKKVRRVVGLLMLFLSVFYQVEIFEYKLR